MQTHAEWSPQNWREQTKARRARLGIDAPEPPALRLVARPNVEAVPPAPEIPPAKRGKRLYGLPIGPLKDPRPEAEIAKSAFGRLILLGQGEDAAVAQIIFDTCCEFNVAKSEMLSRQRSKRIVEARQIAIYRISKQTELSLVEIGRRFRRDHTTVIWAIKQVERRIAKGEIAP